MLFPVLQFLAAIEGANVGITIPLALLALLLSYVYFFGKTSKMARPRVFDAPAFSSEENVDVIIVGGGVAGCALARGLGNQGKRVLVLERSLAEPDRIVGELMQPGGIRALERLGMGDCVDGIDECVPDGYAIFRPDLQEDPLLLPFPDVNGEAKLGRSFHHGKLVQKLRSAAVEAETVDMRQGTVTGTIEEKGCVVGVKYVDEHKNRREVYAPLTFYCDGCFSRFRKVASSVEPDVGSYFVGVLLEGHPLPVPNSGNVILASPTPVLGYPISPKDTRVLVDVPAPLPKGTDLKDYLLEKVAPQLPSPMKEAFLDALQDPGKRIRYMPNMKLHPAPICTPGALPLGDVWNCRHPLTGGGMSVALRDAVYMSQVLEGVDLSDYDAVNQASTQFYAKRKGFASTVNILAYALYQVFSTPSNASVAVRYNLQKACIDYLKLGGRFSEGPMKMLSAQSDSPILLIKHFFEVALYGSYQLLFPFPWPSNLLMATRVMVTATNIIVPLMRAELLAQPSYA